MIQLIQYVICVGMVCLLSACSHTETAQIPESDVELVNLREIDPSLVIDAVYATEDNFVGIVFYPENELFIVPEVGERLAQVNAFLKTRGYRLKVWDAYRPLQVQRKMWSILPDDRYVANPAYGSRHNRGCAVDVTLVRTDGSEVQMPTEYDDFSERAHLDYMDLPPDVIRNRAFLIEAMAREGFQPISTEWWHFDAEGWERYPVLDRNPYDVPLFPEL